MSTDQQEGVETTTPEVQVGPGTEVTEQPAGTRGTEGTGGAEVTPVADPPSKLTTEQVEKLRKEAQEAFDFVDTDKTGYILATEIEDLYRRLNYEGSAVTFTEDELKELGEKFVQVADASGDGKVSFDEFYNALLRKAEEDGAAADAGGAEGAPVADPPSKLTTEQLANLRMEAQENFDFVDTDKTGYILATEIEDLYRRLNFEGSAVTLTEDELKELGEKFIQAGDASGDGKVSFEEFYNALLRNIEDEEADAGGGSASETPVADPPRKLTPEDVEAMRKEVQQAFDYIDADKTGYILATEIEDLYRQFNHEDSYVAFTEDELKKLGEEFLKVGDANGDGKVSFDEFFNRLLTESGYEAA